MSKSAGDALLYLILGGYVQALLAAAFACTVLPLASLVTRRPYQRLLCHFFLFNLFLLGWGIFGNSAWLRLTANRFWVQDDAPVWTPLFPPAPWWFNHAGGSGDSWGLIGRTTFPQLYWLWAATVVPVWLLAGLSLLACIRWSQRVTRADGLPQAGCSEDNL